MMSTSKEDRDRWRNSSAADGYYSDQIAAMCDHIDALEAALSSFCSKVESAKFSDYGLVVSHVANRHPDAGVVRVRDLIRQDLGVAWRGSAEGSGS